MDNHNDYNKQLRGLAGKLRKDMTKAEASLWKYVLRAGMMKGYTFNRQRPVLTYIADFMCKPLKLIIEIDGITHQFEDVGAKDVQRQQALQEAGYTILRFSDNDVLNDIENVKYAIADCIEDIEKQMLT
ncbi:MAG TPA: endonuclease domain-containing protein [Flavipsychrobacter sp.]